MAAYTRFLGTVDGKTNFATLNLPVANGVTVNAGDLVYFTTAGAVSSATITGDVRIIGQAQSTVTGNAAGTNKVLVNVEPSAKYLMQASSALTAATHVGQYFDLTGATGAQKVLVSSLSATTGVVTCLEVNPQIDPVKTDTTFGIFKVVEHAFYPLGA